MHYLRILSPLLQLVFGMAKLDGILILVNFLCAECEHTDVNWDDGLCPVS